MANVLVQESSLQDIADAIRGKLGVQTTYKPSEMADAIDSISGGGITPTGTKQISITENGTTTEDVTNYASAEITANVESSGGGNADSIIDGTIVNLTSNATAIRSNVFNGATSLVTASFPEALSMGTSSLYGCTKLTSLNVPKLTSGGSQCLRGCTALTSASFPAMTTHGNSMFYGCSNLEVVDFGAVTALSAGIFTSCGKLATIILRRSSVVTLNATSVFTETPFASGGSGGTIYVPSDLINTYKSAANWSTAFGWGTITFAAIEGSQYE